MGNTSSERAGLERHGHKAPRGDSSAGAMGTKEGDRPKILMDSPEDTDLFHAEEMKVLLGCSCLLTSPAWECRPRCAVSHLQQCWLGVYARNYLPCFAC